MGNGASVAAQQRHKAIERDIKNQYEHDEKFSRLEVNHHEAVLKLETRLSEVLEKLKSTSAELEQCKRKLAKEQKKNLTLTYCDLPLAIMKENTTNLQLTRAYSMVTISQCDVVNFSSLATSLPPQATVDLINQLQAAIDVAFTHEDIFVMERSSNGCIAVSGLVDQPHDSLNYPDTITDSGRCTRTETPFSLGDNSLYGSELGTQSPYHNKTTTMQVMDGEKQTDQQIPGPSSYASLLATAVLKLMSISTEVHVPSANKQLQLRVAMHSGPCNAGIINMQTCSGTLRAPQYKLFGQTIQDTAKLSSSGLALQIRVSSRCHQLLMESDVGYVFERCPDFASYTDKGTKCVESYWLLGAQHFTSPLPPLDLAISLSHYDDLI